MTATHSFDTLGPMFVEIRNEPLAYAWGADRAISDLLGRDGVCAPAPGAPATEAELWMGAHHGSPSRIVDPAATHDAGDLATWIAADPTTTLGRFADGLREGDGPRLPFLLKVLAAGGPLSLQAHPSLARARAGYAAEDAAGVPRDAPDRNYRDASHKPELLLALSDTMEALVGFRAVAGSRALVEAFVRDAGPGSAALAPLVDALARADARGGLREVVTWILTPSLGLDDLVSVVSATAATAVADPAGTVLGTRYPREAATIAELAERFPGDPGIVLALLLNRVTLRRGEAVFVPAGNLHAYLRGTGIEIMAASDNVLRGGLTTKHVDRAELLAALDDTPVPPPFLAPVEVTHGVREFRPDVADFRLVEVTGGGTRTVRVDGPAIVLCLEGTARLVGAECEVVLQAGRSVFVTPDEGDLTVAGDVDLVIAMPGIDRDDTPPIDAERR
ncbi:mannose-6-phosphate isomerase [Pseudoclavibacter chungangensis]|nr:mannose-6-phosphate isomerase [Pseudoclavibacter chungangensis]